MFLRCSARLAHVGVFLVSDGNGQKQHRCNGGIRLHRVRVQLAMDLLQAGRTAVLQRYRAAGTSKRLQTRTGKQRGGRR